MSEPCPGVICDKFCYVISNKLLHKYIKVPSGETLELAVKEFQLRWGFPYCFGAMDGSHIDRFHVTSHVIVGTIFVHLK